LQFEWDPQKRELTSARHGLDLVDAVPIFEGPMLALPDTRQDYGEDRWIGVGITNGRVAVVAFAECGADCIRIISLRKANRHERKLFEEAVKNELEEG
jgi:uncharacterized DUF497 family protein